MDTPAGRLRVYQLVAAAGVAMLVLFGAVELIAPRWLADPAGWQDTTTFAVAASSALLLGLDVVLPVPSSIVMVGNGALFGLVWGGMLSAAGLMVSSVLAYGLGRWANGRWGGRVREEDVARLGALLSRYGAVFIVASRPVPIVAELAGLVAGAGRMALGTYLWASAAGAVAVGFSYAFIGSLLEGSSSLIVVFGAGALASALMWLWSRRILEERSV